MPSRAGGGIGVDGDEQDVGLAVDVALGVGAGCALWECDVGIFGDEEVGIVSGGFE